MSEELKPCPCCGPEANTAEVYVSRREPGTWGFTHWYVVRCVWCYLQTAEKESVEEAIAAWNQRAKPVVKALEWGDSGFDQSWAKTPFGEVSVQDYSNRAGWTMDICGEDLGEKPTRNEAKRHVEREVARRVHASLEGYDD